MMKATKVYYYYHKFIKMILIYNYLFKSMYQPEVPLLVNFASLNQDQLLKLNSNHFLGFGLKRGNKKWIVESQMQMREEIHLFICFKSGF